MAQQQTPPPETPSPLQKLLQSPRATFLENSDNVRRHRELLQRPELKHAFDVTLAEMSKAVISLSRNTDMLKPGMPQAAEASFHIIQGAHEFIEVFFRLAEPYAKAPAQRQNPDALQEN